MPADASRLEPWASQWRVLGLSFMDVLHEFLSTGEASLRVCRMSTWSFGRCEHLVLHCGLNAVLPDPEFGC